MKKISIVLPCFNEEENIDELYNRINKVLDYKKYLFEIIFIDNSSTDKTIDKIKKLIEVDKNVKLIINARNFGQIRSPYHGMMSSTGNACIMIASDLQDPPEMVIEFIKKWEEGYKLVLAVKPISQENKFINLFRKLYYIVLEIISEVPIIKNATGAGLYDREVIEILKQIQDPNPFIRGLICEIGFKIATVSFIQPERKKGVSKNNLFTLYDIAILGITKHSKLPLRMITILGFAFSFLSFMIGFFYIIYKILYWNNVQTGITPIIIGIFFIGGIQMFFIGILGEYIGSIYTQVRKMPIVIESERINW